VEREGREEGKSIQLSTPTRELLNGTPYVGWWRVRERKRKFALLEREKCELSRSPKHPS
jgi:hypothetical protein